MQRKREDENSDDEKCEKDSGLVHFPPPRKERGSQRFYMRREYADSSLPAQGKRWQGASPLAEGTGCLFGCEFHPQLPGAARRDYYEYAANSRWERHSMKIAPWGLVILLVSPVGIAVAQQQQDQAPPQPAQQSQSV